MWISRAKYWELIDRIRKLEQRELGITVWCPERATAITHTGEIIEVFPKAVLSYENAIKEILHHMGLTLKYVHGKAATAQSVDVVKKSKR